MYINEQISTDEIPKIETIEFQPISKNYLKLLIFNSLVSYGVVMLLLISSTLIPKFAFESKYLWLIFSLVTLVVILFLVVSVYGFAKRKYALRTHDILYTQGLLINKLTTIAYVRIQHIEVSSGLLERKLKLATLSIYTAGDSGSDLVIKGLSYNEANKINAFLSAKMNGEF
jgi:membrane protein YdbS with pleckstrin-like domain